VDASKVGENVGAGAEGVVPGGGAWMSAGGRREEAPPAPGVGVCDRSENSGVSDAGVEVGLKRGGRGSRGGTSVSAAAAGVGGSATTTSGVARGGDGGDEGCDSSSAGASA